MPHISLNTAMLTQVDIYKVFIINYDLHEILAFTLQFPETGLYWR